MTMEASACNSYLVDHNVSKLQAMELTVLDIMLSLAQNVDETCGVWMPVIGDLWAISYEVRAHLLFVLRSSLVVLYCT